LIYGEQARFFEDERRPHLKHKVKGVVGMASPLPHLNASQFYITTGQWVICLKVKARAH
jgi:peptidyl-prolyl cis-trans isomerase-like 4